MSETYNIEVKNNDTYTGVVFTITVNSIPLDLTGSTVQMQVRRTLDSDAIIDLSVGSGLSLTDPAAGQLAIDSQVFSGEPEIYLYDIQITLASGDIKTYIEGNFTIVGDVTRNG